MQNFRTRLQPMPFLAKFVALALIIGGGTTQLAPDFDQSIVDGLTTANEETLTLLHQLQAGPTRAHSSVTMRPIANSLGSSMH